ncbi:MAG: RloB family protein [Bacteroidia bacterium]|nr:RloB family protein [Bacteroidia bacterium]
MSRRRNIRQAPRTIFLACEGRHTEPAYFEGIREEIEEQGQIALTIYPDQSEKRPKTDAMGLIREAQSRAEEFDELWAVFDKDGYTKHREAFELARRPVHGKTVGIAFSSIAFEHWVLLHFERSLTPFARSQEIIEGKFRNGPRYFPGYSKKAHLALYPSLRDRTLLALEHAAWLRFRQRDQLRAAEIYEVNPFTTADQLVARLLGISREVHWADAGETVQLGGFQLETRHQAAQGWQLRISSAAEASLQPLRVWTRTAGASLEAELPDLRLQAGGLHLLDLPQADELVLESGTRRILVAGAGA